MKKPKAVVKWLLRVSSWVENPYEAAELMYQALGDGKPYPWKPLKDHFQVFNEEA